MIKNQFYLIYCTVSLWLSLCQVYCVTQTVGINTALTCDSCALSETTLPWSSCPSRWHWVTLFSWAAFLLLAPSLKTTTPAMLQAGGDSPVSACPHETCHRRKHSWNTFSVQETWFSTYLSVYINCTEVCINLVSQLEALFLINCSKHWCPLWITPPAPGLTGGASVSKKPWSALVETALSLAAMWVKLYGLCSFINYLVPHHFLNIC